MRRLAPGRAQRAYLDSEVFAPPAPTNAPRGTGLLRGAAVAFAITAAALCALAVAIAHAQPSESTFTESVAWCAPSEPVADPPPLFADVAAARTIPHVEQPAHTRRAAVSSPTTMFVPLISLLVVVVAILTARTARGRASAAMRASSLRGTAAESRIGGRPALEDRSFAKTYRNGCAVIALADGLGGHVGGARAAELVIGEVPRCLARLDDAGEVHVERVARLVRDMFPRAIAALAREDAALGLARHRICGLRSTLLVAVRVGATLVTGTIGDGTLVIRRIDGSLQRLFEPQRAGASHLLAASLGPEMDGEPAIGIHELKRGDIVVGATDGLADHVLPSFFDHIARKLDEPGDASSVVAHVLDDLLGDPELQPLFDDNVSLAVIGAERAG